MRPTQAKPAAPPPWVDPADFPWSKPKAAERGWVSTPPETGDAVQAILARSRACSLRRACASAIHDLRPYARGYAGLWNLVPSVSRGAEPGWFRPGAPLGSDERPADPANARGPESARAAGPDAAALGADPRDLEERLSPRPGPAGGRAPRISSEPCYG